MAEAILEKASSPSQSHKDKLYEMMAQKPSSHVFFQHDLTAMGVADNVQTLRQLIQDLASAQLVQILTHDGEVCYKVRAREEAARLNSLKGDEHVIYNHIAESRTNGCWVKSLKAKTNLHTANLSKVIKSLEAKRLIKNVKNVKFPTRKIYMLSDLNPSEDVTGGPWFTEGKLDLDLLEALTDLIVKFVRERSWGTPARRRPHKEMNAGRTKESFDIEMARTTRSEKTNKTMKSKKKSNQVSSSSVSGSQQAEKRNQVTPDAIHRGPAAARLHDQFTQTTLASNKNQDFPLYPPQPHFHPIAPSTSTQNSTHSSQTMHTYPSTAEISTHIHSSGVISLSFSESEFQDLLNMLVWDGRLEDMGMNRYRSTHGTVALIESEREQEKRRERAMDAMVADGADIEDLATILPRSNKMRKRAKDDLDGDSEGGDDVVLGGRDWRKFNRLQGKGATNRRDQHSKTANSSLSKRARLDQDNMRVLSSPLKEEFAGLTNGFANAPCGRCPYFSICGEDGPVSAANCELLEYWLDGGMKNYIVLDQNFQTLEALKEWQPS